MLRSAPPTSLEGPAAELEGRLKAWRRERSRADAVPAYVVASDATLRAIAAAAPADERALGRVNGIGPAKVAKYGEEILEIVAGG